MPLYHRIFFLSVFTSSSLFIYRKMSCFVPLKHLLIKHASLYHFEKKMCWQNGGSMSFYCQLYNPNKYCYMASVYFFLNRFRNVKDLTKVEYHYYRSNKFNYNFRDPFLFQIDVMFFHISVEKQN